MSCSGSGFQPPSEAPVFYPTEEEFRNPLEYIAKIRPEAVKAGIVKIKPPPTWLPPFCADVDTFKFNPRVQRLTELEATNRVRLLFLEKLGKFWETQGVSLLVPKVGKKVLDLYLLHNEVNNAGGYERVCAENKWPQIVSRMNFPKPNPVPNQPTDSENVEDRKDSSKPEESTSKDDEGNENGEGLLEKESTAPAAPAVLPITDPSRVEELISVVRAHYTEKILSYAMFRERLAKEQDKTSNGNASEKASAGNSEANSSVTPAEKPVPTTPSLASPQQAAPSAHIHGAAAAMATGRVTRGTGAIAGSVVDISGALEEGEIDYSKNKELRKLQFFGAGPKAAIPVPAKDDARPTREPTCKMKMRDRSANWNARYMEGDDLDACRVCGKGGTETSILRCDGCDDVIHTFCLTPPLTEVPGRGDWKCPKCIDKECHKPKEAYGFDQATTDYSLSGFGEMADRFKQEFFEGRATDEVPYSEVERRFWKIVTSFDRNVTVQYGADIHALVHGSGFPSLKSPSRPSPKLKSESNSVPLHPNDAAYLTSPWNLNNLPVADQSVLRFVSGDVSGMKVPWCYVGMVFSSFAWHIEDHWSYSINYHHWGEPKTWYGVPASHAEQLESVLKGQAPELFEQSPDLLHQLTTILNPNTLMAAGIPVVRTDQKAGEFIITFPRSYHAGFNQGFNFAEAVNFCPADWLPMGRQCVEQYQLVKRHCVFSHEELLCKIALVQKDIQLDVVLAEAVCEEVDFMVSKERALRRKVVDKASKSPATKRQMLEVMSDDERCCSDCKTTLFMSALSCPCNNSVLFCLSHIDTHCQCDPGLMVLHYRYAMNELEKMTDNLRGRNKAYNRWKGLVTEHFTPPYSSKKQLTYQQLLELCYEAENYNFSEAWAHAKKLHEAADYVNQLRFLIDGLRTPSYDPRVDYYGKETPSVKLIEAKELSQFYLTVEQSPVYFEEFEYLKELKDKVQVFQKEAQLLLEQKLPVESPHLEKMVKHGYSLGVAMPEAYDLYVVMIKTKWLHSVVVKAGTPPMMTLTTVEDLIRTSDELPRDWMVDTARAELGAMLSLINKWDENARRCLTCKPPHSIDTFEKLIAETRHILAAIPNVNQMKEILSDAKEWMRKVDMVQARESTPYMDLIEALIENGKHLPIRLDPLPQLESNLSAARSWKDRTARTFLKKNSAYTLLEVLSPRTDIGLYQASKRKKKREGDQPITGSTSGGGGAASTECAVTPTAEPLTLAELIDPGRDVGAPLVKNFKSGVALEVEMMRELRNRNIEKHRQEDSDTLKYCICRRGAAGPMLQCELCKDWFHSTCVPMPKTNGLKAKAGQAAILAAARDLKFMCPSCPRSRRPRLETILSLLVSLQKLPVKLPEGDSLQCLTERAMAWQDRARCALATDELAAALNKLSVLNQKIVEQAAREKTEKIINTELMKAANNPELQGHLQSVNHGAFLRGPIQQSSIPNIIAGSGGTVPVTSIPAGNSLLSEHEMKLPTVIAGKTSSDMSEHAYSSVSKAGQKSVLPGVITPVGINSATGVVTSAGSDNQGLPGSSISATVTPAITASPSRNKRKSALVPRQMLDRPVLELSDIVRAQLEDLMMEGDLLEVSVDETQHIWKMLQACSKTEEKFMEFEELQTDCARDCPPVEKKRKRKFQLKPPGRASPDQDRSAFGGNTPSTNAVGGDSAAPPRKLSKTSGEKKTKKLSSSSAGGFGGGAAGDGNAVIASASGTSSAKKDPAGAKKKVMKKAGLNKKKLGVTTPVAGGGSVKKAKGVRPKGVKPKGKRLSAAAAAAALLATPSQSLEHEDSGEEPCSAPTCLTRSVGENDLVDWVQCDECEQWYHNRCIGLTMPLEENEEFKCPPCLVPAVASSSVGAASIARSGGSSRRSSLEITNAEDKEDVAGTEIASTTASIEEQDAPLEEEIENGEEEGETGRGGGGDEASCRSSSQASSGKAPGALNSVGESGSVATHGEPEEVISVVSTPIPSATGSPVEQGN